MYGENNKEKKKREEKIGDQIKDKQMSINLPNGGLKINGENTSHVTNKILNEENKINGQLKMNKVEKEEINGQVDPNQVIVYVLNENKDNDSTNAIRTVNLFSDPLFYCHIMTIKDPNDDKLSPNLSKDSALEAYRVNMALNSAASKYPENTILLAKDSTVSEVNADKVADVVSAALSSSKKKKGNDEWEDAWHMCYLSKWMDRCDLYSKKRSIKGTTTSIAKTVHPQGFQAVMLTPTGRDVLLGKQNMLDGTSFLPLKKPLGESLTEAINGGKLEATCTVPNLLRYDPSLASSPEDYLKFNECHLPLQMTKNGERNYQQTSTFGSGSWFWIFLLVLLALILGGYFLYKNKHRYSL